jgi:predicted phage tail protein
VVGSCVHSASKDVLYYTIAAGSLSFVFEGIRATVFNSGVSLGSALFSTGYSMHLGEVSISKSLEESS